jgi:hypothetical protein
MVLVPCLSGCGLAAGFVVGKAIEHTSRANFTADFQKQNLERQKAGLPPLDWCSEIYRTKPQWYRGDASCATNPPKAIAQPTPST